LTIPSVHSERGLLRAVGVLGLSAAIINSTIGGGIFRLPANASGMLGTAAPLAYIICAVVMALIALCIAEAGSRVSSTGGPYAYVEIAFGPFVGFFLGVMLWIIGTTAVGAVSTVFIDNVGAWIPFFATTFGRVAGILALFIGFATVNVLGVKYGSRLSIVTTIMKLVPLGLLALVGIFAIEPSNLTIEAAPAPADLMRASIVLLFAFTGVESALIPGGELRDPARTVPRAILFAMTAITVLYITLHLVAQGVLGPALGTATTPLADAGGIVFGSWGRTLLLLGVIISTFGYLSVMTLATPRALFALGRDGFLPRAIASVHAKFHTPWVAIIVQAAITASLGIFSGFTTLAVISNVAALLVYLGCAGAAYQLKKRDVRVEGATPFKMRGAVVVQLLASVLIIGLLTSITWAEWRVLLAIGAVSTLIFFITRSSRNNAQ
jgi:APA family basic amino acid/polyamine antiporter